MARKAVAMALIRPSSLPLVFFLLLLPGGQCDQWALFQRGHNKSPDEKEAYNPGWENPCETEYNVTLGIETRHEAEVAYVYEIETNTYVDPADMSKNMLPALEVAVNDQVILPSFFAKCATDDVTESVRDNVASITIKSTTATQPKLAQTLEGISTRPPDKVLDVQCSVITPEQMDEGNHCTKVEGRLTLYLNEPESTEISETQDAISAAISSGSLVSVNETIVRIAYVSDGPYDPDSPTEPIDGDGDVTNMNTYTYVIGASVAFVVVAVLALVGMRMRNNDDNEENNEDEEGGKALEDVITRQDKQIEDDSSALNMTYDTSLITGLSVSKTLEADSYEDEHV